MRTILSVRLKSYGKKSDSAIQIFRDPRGTAAIFCVSMRYD